MEQIELDNTEDITLFTDEEQVSVKTVDAVFEQHCPLRGEHREFTLFNGSHCHQRVSRKFAGKTKHRVNLQTLDPAPRRRLDLARGWLITSAILGILSFLLIYRQFLSGQAGSSLLVSLIAVSLSLFIISLMLTLFLSRNRIRYYSRYGRVPLLELIANQPDSRSLTDFMRQLSHHVRLSQHNHPRAATQALSFELRDLRRLRDEGVIDDQQYEEAKQRIFAHPAYRA
jgi:hypothetical protein